MESFNGDATETLFIVQMKTAWYLVRQNLIGWFTGLSWIFWGMGVISMIVKIYVTRTMIIGELFLMIMLMLGLWNLGFATAARIVDDETCVQYQTLSVQVLFAQSLILTFYPVIRIVKLLSNGMQMILLVVFFIDIYLVLQISGSVKTECEHGYWYDSYWHVPSMVLHLFITFAVNFLCMWFLLKYIQQFGTFQKSPKFLMLKKVLTVNLIGGCLLYGFSLISCIVPPIRTSRIFLTWHVMLYFSVISEILFSLNTERTVPLAPSTKAVYY